MPIFFQMKKIIIILLFFIILDSCQSQKKAIESVSNMPLKSTVWIFTSVENQNIDSHQLNSPYIVFDTNGRYYGNYGCNKFFGTYYTRKKRITMDFSGATKKLCSDMEIERIISKNIKQNITNYKISQDTLILFSNKTERFKFTSKKNILE